MISIKNARMGLYDQSLRNLLDPAVWSGLSVDDYTTWAHAVWNIIVLRALRRWGFHFQGFGNFTGPIDRGQKRLFQGVIFPRKPYGQFNMKFFDLDSDGPLRCRIHESLGEVLRLKVSPLLE